jgi:hypothetical protein
MKERIRDAVLWLWDCAKGWFVIMALIVAGILLYDYAQDSMKAGRLLTNQEFWDGR